MPENLIKKFVQNILPIVFMLTFEIFFGQQAYQIENTLDGEMSENIENGDSIFFTNGILDKSYFQVDLTGSEIIDKKFELKIKLSYPHKFMVNLKSERNDIAYRGGNYFIDSSTTFIKIDSLGECSLVDGKTNEEFKEKFIPFLFKDESYDCREYGLAKLLYDKDSDFDQTLLKYIKINSDSFIGLWFLIERIELKGYSKIYEKGLQYFSSMMQKEKLWQTANNELSKMRIRKNEKFPSLELKSVLLQIQPLVLPKAKYTLVDFWFSSCRPCLKVFPDFKELYAKYHTRGFEIIGISVDKTNSIEKWQKLIQDKKLIWDQYLDENGKEANREKITVFPTSFLLNEKGEVIKKNISVKELEHLLEAKIGQKH